ncbi:MAG: class I SAM-dependent methyltransferase [Chloroflexota bacterium]|nr:class I SAM-dependent methyltransferase [Chloroflexota bacterium]
MNNKHIALPELRLLTPTDWQDYELLDSGDGETLERFGPYKLIRSEPQAIWSRTLPKDHWDSVDAIMVPTQSEYGGYWEFKNPVEQPWIIDYKGLKCEIRLSKSRHIGVFPEQASHWNWIESQIKNSGRPLRVINLFGYTGMATAAAARAGAHVTHVDASKHAVAWASRNLDISGLSNAPVRWLVEDARKYLKREIKRKSYYDGIILDPPKFGRGPSGKVWDYFEDISDLLNQCRRVLSSQPRFICLTSYAIQASALVPHQAVQEIMRAHGGSIVSGELVTVDSSGGHILSHSLYTRWSSD